ELGEYRQFVPAFMQQIIAEITQRARKSPDINQRSGVSVRASVANYEAMLANALRRAIQLGETDVVPRISDLPFIMPSLQGKIEFEAMEEGREEKIMQKLFDEAVRGVFDRFLDISTLESLALSFAEGMHITTGSTLSSVDYEDIIRRIDGLEAVVVKLTDFDRPAIRASATEFILEGLHLHQLLNKQSSNGRTTYQG
ncbi:MAG: hypothetical protein KDI36_19525, partial [Pseudomonadales bacterium]|nr:hypothetical protein [Pseudomonadales bacterium]